MKSTKSCVLALITAVFSAMPILTVAAAGSTATVWLPIVATRTSVADALAESHDLEGRDGELQLVASDDCRNLRQGLYVVVAGIHSNREKAESALERWRTRGIDDAYLRHCEVVTPSRLSFGIPLLDPSLTRRPVNAVNWELDDALSYVVSLDGGLLALIVPRYEFDPEDIREGLRIGVHVYRSGENRSLDLSPDCIDPDFAVGETHLAVSCITETAASYLLHTTRIFSLSDGSMVVEENRCGKPQYERGLWSCQKESVDAEGLLTLRAQNLPLPLP